jgi:hypothetical protein
MLCPCGKGRSTRRHGSFGDFLGQETDADIFERIEQET